MDIRPYKYDVYISADHHDWWFVGQLSNALRNRGLTVSGLPDVRAGEDWTPSVASSRFIVPVLTPHYLPSEQAPLDYALAREKAESNIVVLPVRRGLGPLPPPLQDRRIINFSNMADFERNVVELERAIKQLTPRPETPTAPETTPIEVPADLAQSCTAGECVLFAGAGLSARAGIPVWSTFLADLLRYAVQQQTIDTGYAESLEAALNEGGRDEVADGIVQSFEGNRKALYDFLESYYPEKIPITPAHEALRQIPFSAVITSNYDSLLEKTFPEYASDGIYTPTDAEQLLDALSQKRRFLLKLYGDIEHMETLIIAPFEYRHAVASNIPFSRFTEGVFFSRTFLFVGMSLEGIQDFLSGFVFRGVSPRKHFALVAVSGTAWKVKAELLKRRYNIHVIEFLISDAFPEVDEFLRELAHTTRPVAKPGPSTSELQGLRRLVLEDIGAYERLELDFPREHNWKVLLGDNGVGKSTVLRAIAVAIIGSDAKSYAARLVRAGKTKGRITLYTERNPASGYVTEILTKDMLAEAEVVSLPSRPMEAEGWLALGFSPLRLVTWASTAGPQPIVEKGRPTSDDLLPLVSGEADPRMDRLKQWIVNLDSADRPGRALTLSGHSRRISSVVFCPDGRTLISGGIDGTIRFWDCWTGAETRKIDAHTAGINALSLSSDGKLLVSGSFDRLAKTWNVSTGSFIREFKGSGTQILSVAFDDEKKRVFTSSESGSIRIWDDLGEELDLFHVRGGIVQCLGLSPDRSTLACGTYTGTIDLHNAETGLLLTSFNVREGTIVGVAWSSDGKTLISGSMNGAVNIWDVESGARIRELPCADTRAVAISPDGRTIAAGLKSGEIKAWDSESGAELMSINAHPQPVRSLAFSSDGRSIASASDDKTIRIWSLPGSLQGGNQQQTIRKFFRLIGELTDREDVDFLRVADDFRVMVKTADAPNGVPLELLSQGMTSLFGWVGVVCQRLKETLQTATQDPLPTNSYALVLIDELDAHMHPRWQQVLVARLKSVFPNVQFIATTHSPLIVGGLAKEELERFTIQDGKIVRASFDPDMMLGRTDQILTGDLFGLSTTLDSKTQDFMQEYEELLGKSSLSEEENSRLRQLERLIEDRIPPAHEQPVQRRARELLDALQAADLEKIDKRVAERMSHLAKALRGDTQ